MPQQCQHVGIGEGESQLTRTGRPKRGHGGVSGGALARHVPGDTGSRRLRPRAPLPSCAVAGQPCSCSRSGSWASEGEARTDWGGAEERVGVAGRCGARSSGAHQQSALHARRAAGTASHIGHGPGRPLCTGLGWVPDRPVKDGPPTQWPTVGLGGNAPNPRAVGEHAAAPRPACAARVAIWPLICASGARARLSGHSGEMDAGSRFRAVELDDRGAQPGADGFFLGRRRAACVKSAKACTADRFPGRAAPARCTPHQRRRPRG
jgi:hypothetical protein